MKRAAVFSVFLRGDQIAALRFELRGHAVEGARQRIDFVALFADRDARLQIAGGDAPRGADEPADRFGHAGGAGQADPARGQQHQHGVRDIGEPEQARAASSADRARLR